MVGEGADLARKGTTLLGDGITTFPITTIYGNVTDVAEKKHDRPMARPLLIETINFSSINRSGIRARKLAHSSNCIEQPADLLYPEVLHSKSFEAG